MVRMNASSSFVTDFKEVLHSQTDYFLKDLSRSLLNPHTPLAYSGVEFLKPEISLLYPPPPLSLVKIKNFRFLSIFALSTTLRHD